MSSKEPKQYYISKPIFEGARNAVINCQVEGCDWHYADLRPRLKEAWNQHYRMNHSQEIGVMEITPKFRNEIWLPSRTRE